VLVLVFATLPLAGTCFLFGGVSATSFLDLTAFVVGIAVLGTAAGIVASAWSRSVSAAAGWSYTLAIAAPLFHLALVAIYVAYNAAKYGRRSPFDDGAFGLEANPFFAWTLIGGRVFGSGSSTHPGWTFLAWTFLFGAVAVAFASWRVGREAAHETAGKSSGRRAATITYDNPVLDRALRGSIFHAPRWSSASFIGLVLLMDAVLLVLAHKGGEMRQAWPHVTFLCIMTFVAAVASMSVAANSIAAERETGALELLLATRLTARDVVLGKFAASLSKGGAGLAIALAHGIVAVCLTKLTNVALLAWRVGAVAVLLLVTSVGTWCSASASTAGRGVLRAYAFVVGGAVVLAVGAGIFIAMIEYSRASWGDEVVPYVFGPSPVFVGLAGVMTALNPPHGDASVHLIVAWVMWSAIYMAGSIVLLRWASAKLEKRNEPG
jgi:ABC-type transport system involved in multi-copper enzyme maturation permease subunit